MAQESKEPHKITLGFILSWIFGVLFGISGLIFLFSGAIISGGSLILASIILLPPINKLVKEQWKFELSGGVKIIAVIILFVIYGVNLPSADIFSDSRVVVQPTERVQTDTGTPVPPTPSVQKVKSASIIIDRVQIVATSLDTMRVTVTNTGDVTINPKFDVTAYDRGGNEICSGSPLFHEFKTIGPGSKKTGELQLLVCSFDSDGTYTLRVDLLDSDYSKLDAATKDFTVAFWGR